MKLGAALEADLPTYHDHCRRLLRQGCDGLAVLVGWAAVALVALLIAVAVLVLVLMGGS